MLESKSYIVFLQGSSFNVEEHLCEIYIFAIVGHNFGILLEFGPTFSDNWIKDVNMTNYCSYQKLILLLLIVIDGFIINSIATPHQQ